MRAGRCEEKSAARNRCGASCPHVTPYTASAAPWDAVVPSITAPSRTAHRSPPVSDHPLGLRRHLPGPEGTCTASADRAPVLPFPVCAAHAARRVHVDAFRSHKPVCVTPPTPCRVCLHVGLTPATQNRSWSWEIGPHQVFGCCSRPEQLTASVSAQAPAESLARPGVPTSTVGTMSPIT